MKIKSLDMSNNDINSKETDRPKSRLKRRIILLLVATLTIWICGWDEWLEYYIELGIYKYKIWLYYGGGTELLNDLWSLNFDGIFERLRK